MGGLFKKKKTEEPISREGNRVNSLQIQQSTYGATIPVVYGTTRVAGNIIDYVDFTPIAHTKVTQQAGGGGGGKGGGGGSSTVSETTYTYRARFVIGLCMGAIAGIDKVWKDKEVVTLSSLGLSFFPGNTSQSPWGEMLTKHPERALNYKSLAYVAGNLDLGDNPSSPNFNFEIQGKFIIGGGKKDANPKDVIYDLLTNTVHGSGFPQAYIDDLSDFSNYCIANGFFISPVYAEQQPAHQRLSDLAIATNSAFVWSQGKLKLVPFGDKAVTGNDIVWSPDLAPVYNLTEDDFLETPMVCKRSIQADVYNSIKLEFLNREHSYNVEIVEVKDQGNIELYGERPRTPIKAHMICDPLIAKKVAQTLLDRSVSYRNRYTFKLPIKYILLEPMDVVTITDNVLGLDQELVRILSIKESGSDELEVEVEEMQLGSATAALYDNQNTDRTQIDYNADPGDVNPVIVFEPPFELCQTELQAWIGVSGSNEFWGGAELWISEDDITYKRIGNILNPIRQGVTTAECPFFSGDPDTTSTLSVDMTSSQAVLLSGTQTDVDNWNTLCYMNGEFFAYRDATLTDDFQYDITYFHRGLYKTIVQTHAVGSDFVRVDSTTFFKYNFRKEDIGKNIYVKAASFNVFNNAVQDLSELTPTVYRLAGTSLSSVDIVTVGDVANDLSSDASVKIQKYIDDASIAAKSSQNRSVVIVRVPEGDFRCNNQITVKPNVSLRVDGMLHNYMSNIYNPLIIFQAGSHCDKLQIWGNGKSGVVFGETGEYCDMQIGDVRLLNIGEQYSGQPQIGVKFTGYNFTCDSIDVDGGNVGVDFNTCSDVRIDKIISFTASTAIRITSACEHIFVSQLDIDTANYLAMQIDTCNDIELPSVTIFNNDNEGGALTSGYAIKVGQYSAADIVENIRMNARITNTGGTAVYLSNIDDAKLDFQINNGNLYTGNTHPIANGIEYGTGIGDSVHITAEIEVATSKIVGNITGRLTVHDNNKTYENKTYKYFGKNTDSTYDLQKFLDILGGGHVDVIAEQDYIYFNGSLDVPSNTHLHFKSPVKLGSYGQLRIYGSFYEYPDNNLPKIRQDLTVGATRIYCGSQAESLASNYAVGNKIIIRGLSDGNGRAIEYQECTVTAVSAGGNYIDVAEPLEYAFKIQYPNGDFYNNYGVVDYTFITITTFTKLTGNASRGATTIAVTSTSGFAVDDYVFFGDGKTPAAIAGTSNNTYRHEVNKIIAINSLTITLENALSHDYETSYNAYIMKMNMAENASIDGAIVNYSAEPYEFTTNAFTIAYAKNCWISNCVVENKGTYKSKGHGFRIDRAINCHTYNCAVYPPGFVDAAEGYGFTFYRCNHCSHTNAYARGCRHSFLFFRGASFNRFNNVTSIDCRKSDIDFHGGDEYGNIVDGFTIVGGDSTQIVGTMIEAIKFGNESHVVGGYNNVVKNGIISDFKGYGITFIPLSANNIVENVVFRNIDRFVRVVDSPASGSLTVNDNVIRSCFVDSVVTDLGNIDSTSSGGSGQIVEGLVIEKCTFKNIATYFKVFKNTLNCRIINNTFLDGVNNATDPWILKAVNADNLVVKNNYIEKGTRFVSIQDCSGFKCKDNTLKDFYDTIVLDDVSNNDFYEFDYNEFIGFDETYAATGGGSTVGNITNKHQAHMEAFVSTKPFPINITTVLPGDNTTPLISEGDEIIDWQYIPKNARCKLRIEVYVPAVYCSNTTTGMSLALFKDSTCIAANLIRIPTSGASNAMPLSISAIVDITSKTPISLKARLGPKDSTGSPIIVVGDRFNGLAKPMFIVQEIASGFESDLILQEDLSGFELNEDNGYTRLE